MFWHFIYLTIALEDIYFLESLDLNMEVSLYIKLFWLCNILNSFFFREDFSNYCSQKSSLLFWVLSITCRKDNESGSPGHSSGFQHFLVPLLEQVIQLTSPNFSFPICKTEAPIACQTQLSWGLNDVLKVSSIAYGMCSVHVLEWINNWICDDSYRSVAFEEFWLNVELTWCRCISRFSYLIFF